MSRDRIEKLYKKPPRPSVEEGSPPLGTIAISSYAADIVKGLRRITKGSDRKDLVFLDYLLALAEQEADSLASNIYH